MVFLFSKSSAFPEAIDVFDNSFYLFGGGAEASHSKKNSCHELFSLGVESQWPLQLDPGKIVRTVRRLMSPRLSLSLVVSGKTGRY